MSTKGLYTFKDAIGKYQVYVHWDNMPEEAIVKIKRAMEKAWVFPRFEADEFAAAFVASNKNGEGNVRLLPHNNHEVGDFDCEYHYTITFENGKLQVNYEDTEGNHGTYREME